MDYQKCDYKKIFSERLYELSETYVQRKKQEITEKNKDIDKQNREKKNKAKLQMTNISDYQLIPSFKPYSIEKLVEDIENRYHCGINYRNYNLYRKGESFPNDPYMIKSFADFFQVSLEYMYGFSDIPNALNNKIQETIHLSSNAINTLIRFSENKNEIPLTVMNALLSDEESSINMFINTYEQAYSIFEQEKSMDIIDEFDTQILLQKNFYEKFFNKYLERYLIPLVKEEFEQRLASDRAFEYWRSHNYDEYEKQMREDLDCIYGNDVGKISIKITGVDDDQ